MTSEYGNGIGWTLYPPLSSILITLTDIGIDLILCSLLISGISTSFTSTNFILTLLIWKIIIISKSFIDIYIWSSVIVGNMLLIVLPIFAGSLLLILYDLHYNTVFFDSLYGGDPVFYQHIFWFFGHPEVYVLIIPGFGLISNVLSEHINIILFGYQSMILAISCISYLGSIVWSHHMFTVGMEIDSRVYFMSSTILISLPTGTKMYNWLCTYLNTYQFKIIFKKLALIYIKMFLIMFTLGGSSGLILGNSVLDISLHDTYYVVSHFHIILSLGAILSIFVGISYYQEFLILSITNVSSLYHLMLIFIGIFLTFIPLHFLSFNTLPRRISDFPDSLN